MTTPIYLMSPPRADWALRGRANFKSRAATTVDAEGARQEWTQLADAIVAAGGEVILLPPGGPELTGMIYTAEAGEFYRGPDGEPRFLLPHMAAEHRRGEAAHIRRFVEDVLQWSTDEVDCLWEAQGDAIRHPTGDFVVHTYGVGPDSRTEAAAYEKVASRLGSPHIQIEFLADPWFHGNTFLQFFGHGDRAMMVVCPEALAPGEFRRLRQFVDPIDVVTIGVDASQGYDTNSLQVGDVVLAPQTLSATTREAVQALGLSVQTIDLGELFSKGGGAPVCLTNRLWGLSLEELPREVRWSLNPKLP